MKKFLFFSSIYLIGIASSAQQQKYDLELETKKVVALKIIKAAVQRPTSDFKIETAFRTKNKVIVEIIQSYESEDSGVICRKTIEFSADNQEGRLKTVKIIEGMCFS